MYKLIDQGEVPAYKIGRVFRIRRSDLDDFLERSRVQPAELATSIRRITRSGTRTSSARGATGTPSPRPGRQRRTPSIEERSHHAWPTSSFAPEAGS